MKPFYLAIYCLFCCVPMLADAQSNPDSNAAIILSSANFPSHFFDKINSRTTSLKKQLGDQTARYLRRMAREESRLQRNLTTFDSGKAAALYAQDPQQQYALLAQKLRQDSSRVFSSMGPEYLPYADSLQGMLAYLNAHPALLNANPALLGKVQTSLASLQQLQSRLQLADQIKAYIQSRKAQIEQTLSGYSHIPPGITNALDGYKRQAYYYADQVRAYRAMLNDPDKMMRTALAILNKVPAFTAFMKQNSFLAGLVGVPAGYGTPQALEGMQTRDQILAIIQSKLGSGSGGGGMAALQSSLQTAHQDISKLQNKLSSLGGGSGDMDMPDFKPNQQKTKRFLRRLEYGVNLQTTRTDAYYPNMVDMGGSLGYKLNNRSTIGIGASYKMGLGPDVRHMAISSNGAGLRSFIDVQVKGSFSATGGFEYNHTTPLASFQDFGVLNTWSRSGLIGVTKTVSMKSNVFKKTKLQLLWDFLSYSNVPQTQPILFRVGYTF